MNIIMNIIMNTIMNINDFKKDKPISMVTCYDYTFARALDKTNVDCVLVGDSVAMVVYGEDSTTHATTKMIVRHVKAVKKGFKGFIIADLPFLSLQKSKTDFLKDVKKIINAGASAIKIEGVTGNEIKIKMLVNSGIPVVGHVGLTPQFVHSFGGFKVQGRGEEKKEFIRKEALSFQSLGAFMLVIECVPIHLSVELVDMLSVPTVGIGAGMSTDGQVLVLYDLLGLSEKKFKFVKCYKNFFQDCVDGVESFKADVNSNQFPDKEHSFL